MCTDDTPLLSKILPLESNYFNPHDCGELLDTSASPHICLGQLGIVGELKFHSRFFAVLGEYNKSLPVARTAYICGFFSLLEVPKAGLIIGY